MQATHTKSLSNYFGFWLVLFLATGLLVASFCIVTKAREAVPPPEPSASTRGR